MLLESRTETQRRVTGTRVSAPVAIVAGSLVLAALTLLLPSTPTYDPWSWIIWGREITDLELDTVDGPSWKPLPVVFTTVFALFGDAAPLLWVWIGRAGAIAAVALAFVLGRRLAGPVAGVAAAVALALAPWFVRNGALANSEGLLVALLFGAVLAHLDDRRGWAFALGIGCALLRPEVWPFIGLYAAWLFWEDRSRLVWLAAGLASLPILWLGPELWGSGNALRASDRAQQPNPDSPAFDDNPALAVAGNALEMVPVAAVAGLVVLVGLLVTRRVPEHHKRLAVGLTVVVLAWTALVAIMTVGGFSGNERYLIPPAALLIVLGAAAFGWAMEALAPRRRWIVGVAAAAVAAVFAVPYAFELPEILRGVDYQAQNAADLERVIEKAGGKERLLACGHPHTNPFLVPTVAWELGVHGQHVDLDPDADRPATVFHVKHVRSARGRAPSYRDKRGRLELARAGGWIVTADCPEEGR